MAQSLERLKGGNYLYFQAFFCTRAISHLPGIFVNRESSAILLKNPSVHRLRMHLLMDRHNKTSDIYTLTPWDCSSNFGEAESYISRTFQLRNKQWWGNTVNNLLKSFSKWHLKMPLGQGREDNTFFLMCLKLSNLQYFILTKDRWNAVLHTTEDIPRLP